MRSRIAGWRLALVFCVLETRAGALRTRPGMLEVMLRPIVVWVLLALLAVSNGMIREAVFAPAWGSVAGHVISTAILAILILIVSAASLGFLQIDSPRRAWTVGLEWLALTLAFEFLAGHFLFGNEWASILHDYNLFDGRVWIAVPLATLTGPRLAFMVRRRFN